MKPSWILLPLFFSGCGPTFAESRLASYRPRGDECELGLVGANATDQKLGDKWRVIGYVSVDGLGHADPLAQRNRELVRARLCRMGGIAVAVAVPGMTETPIDPDADVTYAALRPAAEPAPEMPQKF